MPDTFPHADPRSGHLSHSTRLDFNVKCTNLPWLISKCTDQPSKIPWSSRNNELLCDDYTFLMSILVLFKVRVFLELEGKKCLMRWAVLNECHRNWRFHKLWLLIGPHKIPRSIFLDPLPFPDAEDLFRLLSSGQDRILSHRVEFYNYQVSINQRVSRRKSDCWAGL
jgi:hypothetical protein